MRQRLGIAAALLREPRLLLLDEPTTGLDPAGMRDMRDLVRRLAHEGLTVLLSSHLLTEVEELCNRVAIIRKGSIVYEGPLAELKASAPVSGYRLRTTDPTRARVVCTAQGGVTDVRPNGERRASLQRGRGHRRVAVARARRGRHRHHHAGPGKRQPRGTLPAPHRGR